MKHTLKVIFGQEQVTKMYEGQELTQEEVDSFVKEYHFDTIEEKQAFIDGLNEALGWEQICIPELEFSQD